MAIGTQRMLFMTHEHLHIFSLLLACDHVRGGWVFVASNYLHLVTNGQGSEEEEEVLVGGLDC